MPSEDDNRKRKAEDSEAVQNKRIRLDQAEEQLLEPFLANPRAFVESDQFFARDLLGILRAKFERDENARKALLNAQPIAQVPHQGQAPGAQGFQVNRNHQSRAQLPAPQMMNPRGNQAPRQRAQPTAPPVNQGAPVLQEALHLAQQQMNRRDSIRRFIDFVEQHKRDQPADPRGAKPPPFFCSHGLAALVIHNSPHRHASLDNIHGFLQRNFSSRMRNTFKDIWLARIQQGFNNAEHLFTYSVDSQNRRLYKFKDGVTIWQCFQTRCQDFMMFYDKRGVGFYYDLLMGAQPRAQPVNPPPHLQEAQMNQDLINRRADPRAQPPGPQAPQMNQDLSNRPAAPRAQDMINEADYQGVHMIQQAVNWPRPGQQMNQGAPTLKTAILQVKKMADQVAAKQRFVDLIEHHKLTHPAPEAPPSGLFDFICVAGLTAMAIHNSDNGYVSIDNIRDFTWTRFLWQSSERTPNRLRERIQEDIDFYDDLFTFFVDSENRRLYKFREGVKMWQCFQSSCEDYMIFHDSRGVDYYFDILMGNDDFLKAGEELIVD